CRGANQRTNVSFVAVVAFLIVVKPKSSPSWRHTTEPVVDATGIHSFRVWRAKRVSPASAPGDRHSQAACQRNLAQQADTALPEGLQRGHRAVGESPPGVLRQ